MYSEKTEAHYLNPYKEGKLVNITSFGTAEDKQRGEKITFWILAKDNKIQQISFEAEGSCALIAVGSSITTLVEGKEEREAFHVSFTKINEELGGLPWEKLECIELGKMALQKAIIEDYKKQQKELDELCLEKTCMKECLVLKEEEQK